MMLQPHNSRREMIVGKAVESFVAELRRIDVIDLLAYARLERHDAIEELVRDAAELHFAPGFVEVDGAADVRMDWNTLPEVVLHLAMRPAGMRIHFSTVLTASSAKVRLTYVGFDRKGMPLEEQTDAVRRTIQDNMIRPRNLDCVA